MPWKKHTIDGARGPLTVWFSQDNMEIVPICTEQTEARTTIEYERIVAGKTKGLFSSVRAAKAAL